MRGTYLPVTVGVVLVFAVTACAQNNLPQPVQAAIHDLAQRLAVAPQAITVVSMERVTWPDASLGNLQPGRTYAQVRTEGFRIVLQHDGVNYEYHTDMATAVTLVQPEGEEPLGSSPEMTETEQRLAMIRQAKHHLAGELGVEPGDIFLASLEEVTWPNTSLGAARPPEQYARTPTPGYLITFEVNGRLFAYHTDLHGRIVTAAGVEVSRGQVASNELPPVVETAQRDLAARLGLAVDRIEVEDVEAVQWPDGAMGLPEPGMMYTQAIVPGYRVILAAQGRRFSYHTDERRTIRFAGVLYPSPGTFDILHLTRTEPRDGNNFFDLRRTDPNTRQSETVVELVSGFAVTPDGQDLIVIKRKSRSAHQMAYVNSDGSLQELATAFDFYYPSWDCWGRRLAYWSRRTVADRTPQLWVLTRPSLEPQQLSLPDLPPATFAPGELVWTNDGLALTIHPFNGPPRSFFWNGDNVEPLGECDIMGSIPRTRMLIARTETADGAALVVLLPGQGEVARLLTADAILAAAARGDEPAIAVVVEDEGQLRLLNVSWEGMAEEIMTLSVSGETTGTGIPVVGVPTLDIAPVGDIAALSYVRGEERLTTVLRLQADQPELLTIPQSGSAVVIVH